MWWNVKGMGWWKNSIQICCTLPGLFKEKLLEFHPRNSALLNATLVKNVASAFINLTVFTGHTITNSYAESVNAQLRRFGVIEKDTCLYQLTLMHHFNASFHCIKVLEELIHLWPRATPRPLWIWRVSKSYKWVLVVMVNKLKAAKATWKVIELKTDKLLDFVDFIKCFNKLVPKNPLFESILEPNWNHL